MELAEIISVDRDKCANCHVCINVCPVKVCNVAMDDHVEINPDLCIGCGQCIEACQFEARNGMDDLQKSLVALQYGKKVVAIVAPAVASNFPELYLQFNGWLKSLGVKAIFDVSFGAELTIKSYLNHLESNAPKCIIAQPCPALVSYIEIYKPELLKYLAPADSPMMHTMKMVREFYPDFRDAEFMVISPCYAKRREFDEVGIGDYNVTITKLKKYFMEKGISLKTFPEVEYDNDPAERAVLFSTPGGLLRTAEREFPDIVNVSRKIEGPHTIYEYLNRLSENIEKGFSPVLIDCLNCEAGCNGGTGTPRDKSMDELEYWIERRNQDYQKKYSKHKNPVSNFIGTRKLKNAVSKKWKSGLYSRN